MNILEKAWDKLTTRGSNPNVNLAGANNMFGTLGSKASLISSSKDFIPVTNEGGIMTLNGDGIDGSAKWIGLENKSMQFWAYSYCSPLAAVIDRLGEADSNGRIKFIDDDDNIVKSVNKNPKLLRIKKLLKKPNPLQTWEEFDSEQVVICKTFGYCPVFSICPFGMDKSYTKHMFNLNPYLVNPVYNTDYDLFGNKNDLVTGKWDNVDRENRIKEWMFTIGGVSYNIPSSDIMLLKDGYLNQMNPDLGLPISKLVGLDFFISNICAAMEADNVLLKKKGPLGVFSYDPKPDMAGATPMSPTDQDEIQDDLRHYGLTLGQLQHVISKMPLKWNPMSFNLRDLMTKETVRQGIDGICDRLGFPAELMSGKNATYENRSSAEKFLYQTVVIPFSLRRMAKYNEFFNLEDITLYMDFDHLPILKEDILKEGQSSEAESNGLLVEWQAGMITWNQWQLSKNRDTVSGMDILYPDWLKMYPELNPQKQTLDVKSKDDKKQPKD